MRGRWVVCRRRQSGQALVEVALVLPLLLVLVAGVMTVGAIGQTDAALLAVVQEAARAGAVADSPAAATSQGLARGTAVAAGYGLDTAPTALHLVVDAGSFQRGGRVWADAEYTVPLTTLPLFGQSRVVLHQRHAEPVDPWRNIP